MDPSMATTLTVRFSAALSDVKLSVEDPYATSVLSFIQLIRSHLPPSHSSLRIRLIFSGRVLTSTSSVASAIRLPPLPPPSRSVKAKGKAPERPPAAPLYVHATFGDELSAATLEAERDAAELADDELRPKTTPSSPISPRTARVSESKDGSLRRSRRTSSVQEATTTPQPQGFDRLLSAGLSPLEVASLRSQFVAILAHSRTPDEMPSGSELRAMEERWLDNDTNGVSVMAGGGASGSGQVNAGGGAGWGTGMGDEDTGGLDDLLWGNILGFFWPVAAGLWLVREEGVWSQRRKMAVVTGMLVNFAFSVMRMAS